jgi:hypothetical protein
MYKYKCHIRIDDPSVSDIDSKENIPMAYTSKFMFWQAQPRYMMGSNSWRQSTG